MANIVIIVGHARIKTYCEVLGESYLRDAEAAGHKANLFITSNLSFDPILHEGFEHVQPLWPELKTAHDAMIRADHLVFIFPLWFGTLRQFSEAFWSAYCSPTGQHNGKGKITLMSWKVNQLASS